MNDIGAWAFFLFIILGIVIAMYVLWSGLQIHEKIIIAAAIILGIIYYISIH